MFIANSNQNIATAIKSWLLPCFRDKEWSPLPSGMSGEDMNVATESEVPVFRPSVL